MKLMFWLRPWRLSDASFILKYRNDPDYMQYYRQDKPITMKEQLEFMKKSKSINYNAMILMEGNKRRGMFALHGSELCIVAPFKYHEVGINLLQAANPLTMIFCDVFTYNPGLETYVGKCGFHAIEVKEKYCKKKGAWVSAIKLCKS